LTEWSDQPAFERMLVFLFWFQDRRFAALDRQYFEFHLNIETNPPPNRNEVAGG
jgi:hypothetical protein